MWKARAVGHNLLCEYDGELLSHADGVKRNGTASTCTPCIECVLCPNQICPGCGELAIL